MATTTSGLILREIRDFNGAYGYCFQCGTAFNHRTRTRSLWKMQL